MTNHLQLQLRLRRLVPAVVIVIGLSLISGVLIQQVAAQDTGKLKPPFKLIRTGTVASFEPHGPEALPLTAMIIMSQTFNSTYSPTPDLNQTGWHESYIAAAASQITWKYVGTGPLANTVWSAGSSLQNPATGTYTNGQQALLIYGPLDLTDYVQLVMTGTYRLDTAPGDYFGLAYSTDGTNWNELYAESSADPTLSQQHTFYASLNPLARKSGVWVALTFVTNNDNLVARGAFVRDVVLRGSPSLKFYMPLIHRDATPTPTATPTALPYLYNYTFGSGAVNDPDFKAWGGGQTNSCGTSCSYTQGIVTTGNPGGAMTIYLNGANAVGGTSPNVVSPANFEYSADLMLFNGQKDARYGLIFDASNPTFNTPPNPPFDPGRNYYKLKLHTDLAQRNHVVSYQLQQCTINGCAGLNTEASLPYDLLAGQWHNMKITQIGNIITFYLDGQALITAPFDSTWDNNGLRRKFGVYVETKAYTSSSNPMEVYFDNVHIIQK